MVTALYRRYRPETFGELIGQSQVTDPLRTALRTDRVNHAYLFSGPRGCGKTTSARILARCLNCAEGPTDVPCGVCPSCVELGRDGGGSLDVVEIDAASHNGVDDARDLRERAVFAPARDRYKIFILDEAHMVTPQGFNALLKIVEEPPEHIKFIFATTEPEKVIGTIRSRTHHYPFRLVPPAQMLEYLQQLCDQEAVTVAAGVLPLVVRAGGGSVRDTLSLLDQLIAGSDRESDSGTTTVEYERAVALLGYTHGALLDEVVTAIGGRDASAAFGAVDRVIQTGQDPRRFVEDLLERLRDLIVVAATGESAGSVLRGVPEEQIASFRGQAAHFGSAELSRAADIVNAALTEMTGATSPRLHLELMIARIMVPKSDETERGALARVERLERRVGVQGGAPVLSEAPAPIARAVSTPPQRSAPPTVPTRERPADVPAAAAPAVVTPAPASTPASTPARREPERVNVAPVSEPGWDVAVPGGAGVTPPAAPAVVRGAPADDIPEPSFDEPPMPEFLGNAALGNAAPGQAAAEEASARAADSAPPAPPAVLTIQLVQDAWPQVLDAVRKAKISAWTVAYTATPIALRDDVLTLGFISENDVAGFRQQQTAGEGVSEILRQAILDVIGTRVKFLARVDAPAAAAVAAPARSMPGAPASSAHDESFQKARYGESVVREILGATFVEEAPLPPRASPRSGD
ncbi:DNA polymerase III subunit gamma and tau [Naasia lichenicola]|uniref:DNA polymerase III subunit gamma/tau n=1 Tax=Naasia lichenicola TaxID=2565933 RepID=A0A4V3WT87_9MICO|nr:DNA polymerase III subunit gamma and tau [Naasia lichenicola]